MKQNGSLLAIVTITLMVSLVPVGRVLKAQGEQAEKEATKAGPRVEAIDPVYDFGEVFRGVVIQHTFTVRNTGDDYLKIKGITKDCGCTVAKIDRDYIAPGGELPVRVTVSTKLLEEGPIEKLVHLATNDKGEPETNLTVTGNVRVTAHLDPARISLKGFKPGDPIPEQVIRITPAEGYDLKIQGVTTTSPMIQAHLIDSEKKGEFQVAVDISSKTMKSAVSSDIKISTNLEEEPVLLVPVRAEIDQPLVIVPSELSFTGVKPDFKGKLAYNAVIRNNEEKPLKILDIQSPNRFITYTLKTIEEGKKYRLNIQILPGFPEGGFEDKVTIFTDSEMYPKRDILVQVNRPKAKEKRGYMQRQAPRVGEKDGG